MQVGTLGQTCRHSSLLQLLFLFLQSTQRTIVCAERLEWTESASEGIGFKTTKQRSRTASPTLFLTGSNSLTTWQAEKETEGGVCVWELVMQNVLCVCSVCSLQLACALCVRVQKTMENLSLLLHRKCVQSQLYVCRCAYVCVVVCAFQVWQTGQSNDLWSCPGWKRLFLTREEKRH